MNKVAKMYGLDNHSMTGEELRRAAAKGKRRVREDKVSGALLRAQRDMPDGHGWNLSSEAACDMLAVKIVEVLDGPIHE